MQARHYVILFDIDKTLIDFHASTLQKIVWTGSAALWQGYINTVTTYSNTEHVKFHIGIATSKVRQDMISGAVLEDDRLIKAHGRTTNGLGKQMGLKRFLNPDLIFFTDGMCKTANALNHVEDRIRKQFATQNILIDKNHIMLIDDDLMNCEIAKANGYQALLFESIVDKDQAERESYIGTLFLKIFEQFNLPIPIRLLEVVGVIDDSDDEALQVEQVEEELINWMSSAEETAVDALTGIRHEYQHTLTAIMKLRTSFFNPVQKQTDLELRQERIRMLFNI